MKERQNRRKKEIYDERNKTKEPNNGRTQEQHEQKK